MLVSNNKKKREDERFSESITREKHANTVFVRIVAKKKAFKEIDFRYCTFDACYFRECSFDSCDFTGSRFVNSNFHGSSFIGCKFEYVTFEKTEIDDEILSSNCPAHENLKQKFARSLRVNYQQLGNAEAANKAIRIELDATEVHLHKAWSSRESYYRKKYQKSARWEHLARWIAFKALDFVWGNGESAIKLLRTTAIILLAIAIIDTIVYRDPNVSLNYLKSFASSPQIFLGVFSPPDYPKLYLSIITAVRLILFGFFMAILVKRLNRR